MKRRKQPKARTKRKREMLSSYDGSRKGGLPRLG